jgi:hypothetical protein
MHVACACDWCHARVPTVRSLWDMRHSLNITACQPTSQPPTHGTLEILSRPFVCFSLSHNSAFCWPACTHSRCRLHAMHVVAFTSMIIMPAHTLFHVFACSPHTTAQRWNAYGANINEALLKQIADGMVSAGLAAAGYTYVATTALCMACVHLNFAGMGSALFLLLHAAVTMQQ